MATFDIKGIFNQYGWNDGFKFSVEYSNSGVARVYINDRMTSYKSGGYGYCKESDVIAKMINDLIGKQPYNERLYGNRNGFLSTGGVGFSSIADSFNSLEGFNLKKLYCGKSYDVYEIKFNLKDS